LRQLRAGIKAMVMWITLEKGTAGFIILIRHIPVPAMIMGEEREKEIKINDKEGPYVLWPSLYDD
jgi:hypothetical protein